MAYKFLRTIKDGDVNKSISVDTEQDFIDDNGVRHPRNVLFLWSDEELWNVLHIMRFEQIEDLSAPVIADPVTIPRPVTPPEPVAEVPQPDEPAPPLPPEPLPEIIHTGLRDMIPTLRDAGISVTDEILEKVKVASHTDAKISQLVAYGGIAVRTLHLEKANQYHQGHRHNYDHMTNLVRGSVLCEVDDAAPKVYKAPMQVAIAADKWHKFTALEDDTIYQCIYRQPEREDLFTAANSPYNLAPFTAEELVEKLKLVDNPCAHCDCDDSKTSPVDDKILL